LEQQDLNKRLILALVLSFVILFGFSYLFPQAQPSAGEANATTAAPAVATADSHTPPASATPAVNPAPTQAPRPVATQKAPATASALTTITAARFVLSLDAFGRVSSVKLLEKKYNTEEGTALELFDPKQIKPLEIRFADAQLNAEAFKVPYTVSTPTLKLTHTPQSVTLTQKLTGLTVVKKLTFYPDGHYDLDVTMNKPVEYFITPGHRPEADHARYMLVRGAMIRDSKGVSTTIEDGKAEETVRVPDATILSAFDRYTASLFYTFEHPLPAVLTPEKNGNPLPFVSAKGTIKLHGYIGPKEYRTLQKLDPQLTDAIEFGWFTFLSRPFFKVMVWIHDYVGNWGWAIVLFTLLVKLILFPLSFKGMMSMQKMKELAPKMKELKAKHKGDPAKLNQQTMELYKKNGANPMGGCLPMLLQIPVFFALYRVLLNANELQGAPWVGWITNLADKDPLYILPVLMGATMWLMQKVQPNTMGDAMQQKIMQWFPVLMTFFFLTFPAGLVLYWLTNNVLSIGQQTIINRAWEKHKAKEKAQPHQ
jgi:YidC/Oxa1 family membrane protein insertase